MSVGQENYKPAHDPVWGGGFSDKLNVNKVLNSS